MGIEFERKYLVGSDGWQRHVTSSSEIAQGYLGATDRATTRVRLEAGVASIGVKSETPIAEGRRELEFQIPLDDARTVLESLCIGRVSKTRYCLDITPYTWTIDVFSGENSGLILLEVESNQAFELNPPDWVGVEVSADPRYKNAYLSTHPFQTWATSTSEDEN